MSLILMMESLCLTEAHWLICIPEIDGNYTHKQIYCVFGHDGKEKYRYIVDLPGVRTCKIAMII